MQKVSKNNNSALKLTAILVVAVLATGCISAKSKPTEVATPAVPAPASEPVADPVDEVPVDEVMEPKELKVWTVVTGNDLWSIAGKEEVYNVPEKWPLVYKANLDQIEDADLIYPGQVLTIPREAGQSEIDAAINHAKTRGAWSVGPVEASDKAYLRNSN